LTLPQPLDKVRGFPEYRERAFLSACDTLLPESIRGPIRTGYAGRSRRNGVRQDGTGRLPEEGDCSRVPGLKSLATVVCHSSEWWQDPRGRAVRPRAGFRTSPELACQGPPFVCLPLCAKSAHEREPRVGDGGRRAKELPCAVSEGEIGSLERACRRAPELQEGRGIRKCLHFISS
jgi:hypothetical protein